MPCAVYRGNNYILLDINNNNQSNNTVISISVTMVMHNSYSYTSGQIIRGQKYINRAIVYSDDDSE